MSFLMSFAEAAQALGEALPDTQGGFSCVSIDSREIEPDALFVALPGEKIDGHCFVKQAFLKGASGALVEKSKIVEYGLAAVAAEFHCTLLPVDKSQRALQDLAAAYLRKFPRLLRVGITGSSGKTTTKEIAAAMASCEKKVICNSGNLNSETGLPLSVFKTRPEHEIGIFELGMNRTGEIAELAAVLEPQIALITNIGSAHIGNLGSKAGIAAEKKAIFSRFTGNERGLIPENDEFSSFLGENIKGSIRLFGEESARQQKKLTDLADVGFDGWEFKWEGEAVSFALPGYHNLRDAFAAAAIADEIGISAEAVRAGFRSARPLFGRSEIIKGPVTLIRDCYNANPESMAAAIEFCDTAAWKGRRVYVLGSMLELGHDSVSAHIDLGKRLASCQADAIFLFGKETESSGAFLRESGLKKNIFQTNDINDLKALLSCFIREGDMILLKGSRSLSLERLCDTIGEWFVS
ncbi:MAG: UDP-N-acetylmuramoyl-tripeptide--D-alanyl-D-alanine ligase [Spirochaetaceae bacterium]|jgi:UDP-N-acetylmuramoyl-tripeptide--D-alanyl-D-alanine ligase|nr:UDP-N-acetylmuramoyl-tripeptide--D-alanyl-D-alanine ligase [Spirochaetaceae bacterium]